MATAYIDRLKLTEDSEFRKRVKFAFIVAAVDILGNPQASTEKKAWATSVVGGKVDPAQLGVAAVLCVGDDIGEAKQIADADIQKVVDAKFEVIVSTNVPKV